MPPLDILLDLFHTFYIRCGESGPVNRQAYFQCQGGEGDDE